MGIFCLPSLASGLEFLIKAENLANISIPAVLDSGCLAPSLEYLSAQQLTFDGVFTDTWWGKQRDKHTLLYSLWRAEDVL